MSAHPDLSNFKNYPVIDAVYAYDACSFSVGEVQLGVVANISTAPYLPECRVIMQISSLGTVLLRPDQSARMREQLAAAEAEAARATALADDKEVG